MLKKILYYFSNYEFYSPFYAKKIFSILSKKKKIIFLLDVNSERQEISFFCYHDIVNACEKKITSTGVFCWIKYENLAKLVGDIFPEETIILWQKGPFLFRVKKKTSVIELYDRMYPKGIIKDLWVLCDRNYSGDDNAEVLFSYICNNVNSPSKLKKVLFFKSGIITDAYSTKQREISLSIFKKLLKHCDLYISSQIDFDNLFFLSTGSKFIFLQHGVLHNDLSSWFNKKRISLLIVSSKMEYDMILSPCSKYRYTGREIAVTGMPRYDNLFLGRSVDKDLILIAPTWRNYSAGTRDMDNYIFSWRAILNSPVLSAIVDDRKMEVVFAAHPMLQKYLNENMDFPSFVRVKTDNETYGGLIKKTELLITDYSSIAFDVGFSHGVTIYYQFDRDSFFSSGVIKNNEDKKAFNYIRDGFGPVVDSLPEFEKTLPEVFLSGYKRKYIERAREFFEYNDANNSSRTLQAINSIRNSLDGSTCD